MKTNHTPGPWEIVIADGETRIVHSIYRQSIAKVVENDNQLANALLMAAAPELLTALIAAKYEIVRLQGGFAGPVCEQIAAAIAKAEGTE